MSEPHSRHTFMVTMEVASALSKITGPMTNEGWMVTISKPSFSANSLAAFSA